MRLLNYFPPIPSACVARGAVTNMLPRFYVTFLHFTQNNDNTNFTYWDFKNNTVKRTSTFRKISPPFENIPYCNLANYYYVIPRNVPSWKIIVFRKKKKNYRTDNFDEKKIFLYLQFFLNSLNQFRFFVTMPTFFVNSCKFSSKWFRLLHYLIHYLYNYTKREKKSSYMIFRFTVFLISVFSKHCDSDYRSYSFFNSALFYFFFTKLSFFYQQY